MSSVRLSVSLPAWVVKDIIGEQKNISGRIEELVIKGYLAQKDADKNAVVRIQAHSPMVHKFVSLMLSNTVTRGVSCVPLPTHTQIGQFGTWAVAQ